MCIFTLLLLSTVKQSFYVVSISLFMMFSFIALTYPAGNDWIGYFSNYDCSINGICAEGAPNFEVGYNTVVSIFGQGGYQSITIAIAIFNLIALYSFSARFENKTFLFFAMFAFFAWVIYTEAVRQAIAMSVLLLAIPSLYKGSKKKFICYVLLAASFHSSAIILILLVIPLISIRLGKVFYKSLLICSIIFTLVPFIILRFGISYLSPESIIYQKLYFYLVTPEYMPKFSAGVGIIFDILLLGLLFMSFSSVKKYQLAKDSLAENITIFGCVLFISFGLIIGKMMPVMTRIGWYGVPFIIILLSTRITPSNYFNCYKPKPFLICTLFIYVYLFSQAMRPFLYDHSRYGIINQETIVTKINELNDNDYRSAANDKCYILHRMGYSYLCTL